MTDPNLLYAIIYGIVEGLTEFIPVSSTAHLLISENILHHHEGEVFNIFIQSGAVLAIIPLFWKKFSGMLFGLKDKANQDYLFKLIVAFAITSVGMLLAEKKGLKLKDDIPPIAWAMLIGGIVIFAVEAMAKGRNLAKGVSWATVVVAFGLGQIVAGCFPGASRSGTTIMVAMIMGLARPVATEFSFILGVPTLLAAGAYKLLKAVKAGEMHGQSTLHLGVGFVVSAIVSFIVVRWLIRYVQSHTFNGFAVYRVLLGIGLFVWVAKGVAG